MNGEWVRFEVESFTVKTFEGGEATHNVLYSNYGPVLLLDLLGGTALVYRYVSFKQITHQYVPWEVGWFCGSSGNYVYVYTHNCVFFKEKEWLKVVCSKSMHSVRCTNPHLQSTTTTSVFSLIEVPRAGIACSWQLIRNFSSRQPATSSMHACPIFC